MILVAGYYDQRLFGEIASPPFFLFSLRKFRIQLIDHHRQTVLIKFPPKQWETGAPCPRQASMPGLSDQTLNITDIWMGQIVTDFLKQFLRYI